MLRKALIIGMGTMLLISLLSIGYVKSQSFMETAAKNLSIEATNLLNTEVKIEKLRLSSVNRISAENVVLYDKTGGKVAATNHIDISFSPLAILQGKSVLGSISLVEVDKPDISINRRDNGEWNYQDFISTERKESNDFQGKVEVNDANLVIKVQDKVYTLDKLQGKFDFAAQPAISFVTEFLHNSSKAEVSGTLGGKNPIISVKTKDFNIENYLDFLPQKMAVKINKGMLKSLDVTITKESSDYSINGEAVVSNVDLAVEGTEINNIDGLVIFNEKKLRLFSRGELQNQPVVLRGTVTLDMNEPVLDMQISSTGFEVSKVLKDFPLFGKVNFEANVYGKYSNPTIEGNIGIKEAKLYGYDLQNINAKVYFADNMLLVEDIDGIFNGGKVKGSGKFDANNKKYHFKVSTENLALEKFSDYINDITGDINADIVIDGQGLEFNNALIYGSAVVENGSYRNLPFMRLNTNFYKNADCITIDYASLVLPQGEVGVEGKIQNGQLDLAFRGFGFDLAELQKLNTAIKVTGLADFSGKINGTFDNPDVKVELTAQNGQLFAQPYQKAVGNISLKDDKLFVNDFTIKNGVESHYIKGFVDLDNKKEINLKVDSHNARAENIIKIAPFTEEITGNINNTVTITGTLDNLKAEGKLDFYEGSFRGVLLQKATGEYKWENGNLLVNDFVISSPDLNVNLNGTLKNNNELDFAVTAKDIDFGKINFKLPYPVSGLGHFSGKLTGTIDSPIFNGNLQAAELSFNDRKVNDVNGKVKFKNNKVELSSVGFKQENGIFNVSGSFNLDTENIQGNLSVEKGSLAAILAIADIENKWIDGALDGSVAVSGTVTNPHIRLKGFVAAGNLKGYPLNNLELDVAVDKQVIKINKFKAQQQDGILAGQGTIDLTGKIDIECAGNNIDAGLLTSLADYKADTKGKLNFGAKIGGNIDNPTTELSIDIQGGGIGNTTFDSLYGLFKLENGIIQVEQLLVQKDVYKASAYGVIPLAAITKNERDFNDIKNQMNLRISLDQADLSILPFLTKEVDWAIGETKGSVNITGTLNNPLINGEVIVKDGAIKFNSLGKPLENLEFDICFMGDRLELKKFQGMMGKGTYQMSGSGKIDSNGLTNYQFVLDLNKLEIANKYYTGPLEGQLVLSDDKIRKHIVPKLSGYLNFEYCTIDIPVLPDSQEEIPEVKLDLEIDLGKKVRLYNRFLYDIWVDGHANFAGSTRRPQSSGEINAIRGTVNYLKTPFKIKEASAYFNQVNSFLPSLHLEADTKLQRTNVYLKINGPADNMKIKLTSNPEMNESEILSLLTLRSRYYDKANQGDNNGIGKDELRTLLDLGLQMSFLSEVENVMRNALGVDEFKVVRDTIAVNDTGKDMDEVYNLEIGKYIDDKVMLHYAKGIDYDSYKFGVRYEFNSRISLVADLDQDKKSSVGFEARFKF